MDGVKLVFVVPEGQRYSCRQCGFCCRWWRVRADPADRDRILQHDWVQERPRLKGVRLFEEQRLPGQPTPGIYLAQLDGQCVFLDEDGLCLIHKVLGLEAKPSTCHRFPVLLGRIGDEVLVGADYSCQAVVYNEGEPFTKLACFVRDLLDRSSTQAGGSAVPNLPAPAVPEPALASGVRMDWPAYLALEGAVLKIFDRRSELPEARLEAAVELVSFLATRGAGMSSLGESKVGLWIEGWREEVELGSCSKADPAGDVWRPLWPSLATSIGDMETPHLASSGRGSAAIGYAVAVAKGTGKLFLSTLHTTVDLSAMGRVVGEGSSSQFDDYLTRFLLNYTLRKSLLESPTIREGLGYLRHCLGLARWYAAASADMNGRSRLEEEDVVVGIQVVEKTYVP